MKSRLPRRIETKLNDGPSVYLLLLIDNPVYLVHGAYSTERKLIDELKRLAKEPGNKLSRAQKRANAKALAEKRPLPYRDPMDRYSIREIGVT